MPNFPTSLAADGSMLKAQNWKSTTLRASMDSTQVTVPVTDASVFPDPAGSTWYVAIEAIDSTKRELVGYTGRDLTGGANALTGVTRHVDGNTIAHSSGVAVELNVAAQFHEALKGEILAVQTKVGIDSSAVAASHDFKLGEVLTASSDKAVGKVATQTLTNKTINGGTFDEIIISAAVSRIRPGGTSLSLRNNANNADNLIITDAGAATFRSTVGGITTLTATTLAGTLSTAAQPNVTSVGTLSALTISGNLTLSAAAAKIIPGVTSLTITATDGSTANVAILDNGNITLRGTLSGITTLTATSIGGTLTTAAQTNITSVGTLSSLTVSGAVNAGSFTNFTTAGTFSVTAAGTASYARQYYSIKNAVTFSATPTIDWNNGNVQSMTLTGNITTLTLSNPQSGGRYIWIITQDATGGRTVAWPAAVKWAGGSAPALSALNKIDVIGLIYDGTNYYGTSSTNY